MIFPYNFAKHLILDSIKEYSQKHFFVFIRTAPLKNFEEFAVNFGFSFGTKTKQRTKTKKLAHISMLILVLAYFAPYPLLKPENVYTRNCIFELFRLSILMSFCVLFACDCFFSKKKSCIFCAWKMENNKSFIKSLFFSLRVEIIIRIRSNLS